MIRRLIILLLIVGCDTEPEDVHPFTGIWTQHNPNGSGYAQEYAQWHFYNTFVKQVFDSDLNQGNSITSILTNKPPIFYYTENDSFFLGNVDKPAIYDGIDFDPNGCCGDLYCCSKWQYQFLDTILILTNTDYNNYSHLILEKMD